ncbi:MAG TPA: TIGR03086 family metal-binding protein, partial [Acidimicrobiia bacterium]
DADLPELHARALDATGRLVAGIGDSQWDSTSIDDEWTVRELVNHVVTGNYWAAELGAGRTIEEVGDRLDGDVLGDDPVAVYHDSAAQAKAVFQEPGAMERPCAVSYGPVPGSVYCGHRFLDVLVHGWDVARSTDQDPTLDPVLVEALWSVLEPQLELLQSTGAFGTPVTVADDASAQTKLLAVLGRRG